MGLDDIPVRYKVGKGKVLTKIAGVSERGTSFGWWRGTGISFLKSLIGENRLVVSAPTYGRTASEAVFSLNGYDLAIARVRKTCGW